jgi:methylmalonyl-CoA mutase N-terminal domain/subunit
VTIQALAAVCGGTQSLHTNSYDEAIGLPTEESATIALRTQQIIAEESGAADVVDPLGGSHYVEYLTDEIYSAALSMIEEIDAKGGAMAAIKEGWQQRQIHNSAYSHLKDVELGKRKIVGVNHGMMEGEVPIKAMKLDDALGEIQRNKLKSLRSNRDNNAVESSLDKIRNAAKNDTNLFPIVIEAIKNNCTLGEIMGAMKDEFGTWMAPSGF